jgi:Fur family peroxide stress response transcriptional regulator
MEIIVKKILDKLLFYNYDNIIIIIGVQEIMEKKELVATLKEKGIQVTPQRLAILEQLKLRKDHPSAEMIFRELKDEFPSLTLATVYNTLEKLRVSHLCIEVNPLHSSTRYDGNTAAHQHAVCINCQKVVDVHDASVSVKTPEWLTEEFRVVSQNLNFYGLCKECQRS